MPVSPPKSEHPSEPGEPRQGSIRIGRVESGKGGWRAEPEASCRGREWPALPPASEGRGEERAIEGVMGGERRASGGWNISLYFLF